MRLFIAIELPEPAKDEMARWTAALSRQIQDPKGCLRWVKKEQFHLTLKFLGETREDRLSQLSKALAATAKEVTSFSLSLGKVGHFGGRAVWLGVTQGAETCARLAKSVDDACQAAGFDPDTRPYTPHMTLARAKAPATQSGGRAPVAWRSSSGNLHLADLPEVLTLKSFGPFNVNQFSLIHSTLRAQGAIYRTLERFPFQD